MFLLYSILLWVINFSICHCLYFLFLSWKQKRGAYINVNTHIILLHLIVFGIFYIISMLRLSVLWRTYIFCVARFRYTFLYTYFLDYLYFLHYLATNINMLTCVMICERSTTYGWNISGTKCPNRHNSGAFSASEAANSMYSVFLSLSGYHRLDSVFLSLWGLNICVYFDI